LGEGAKTKAGDKLIRGAFFEQGFSHLGHGCINGGRIMKQKGEIRM